MNVDVRNVLEVDAMALKGSRISVESIQNLILKWVTIGGWGESKIAQSFGDVINGQFLKEKLK